MKEVLDIVSMAVLYGVAKFMLPFAWLLSMKEDPNKVLDILEVYIETLEGYYSVRDDAIECGGLKEKIFFKAYKMFTKYTEKLYWDNMLCLKGSKWRIEYMTDESKKRNDDLIWRFLECKFEDEKELT